jgi:carbonic anhydrase
MAGSPSNLEFSYHPGPLEVVNNGHTIQVNYPQAAP